MSADELDGNEELELPVWAREEAFPAAGEGYGWMDRKRVRHASATEEELAKTIREDRESAVTLVWTPDSAHCRIPEEIAAFAEPIREVRARWAVDDLAIAIHRMKLLGGGFALLVGWMAWKMWGLFPELERANGVSLLFWEKITRVIKGLASSTTVGMMLLGVLVFAFIPWYQAQKKMREMRKSDGRSESAIPLIRFETWLDFQKAPVTWSILGIISLVFVAQVIHDRSIISFHDSVRDAGLVKGVYKGGDYLRLLTAPMLHGGIIHFVMNALALLYLGKRVEVFARWPHVAMVFLFSALVGGEASAYFTDKTSVGASGGLMGWLGFLLVFETLHSKLVPRSSRRRLIGGVLMTGLIGLVGYKFIDNAAHFGGLLAGIAYAGIVFPRSASVIRPRINLADRVIGFASLAAIAASAVVATLKMAG